MGRVTDCVTFTNHFYTTYLLRPFDGRPLLYTVDATYDTESVMSRHLFSTRDLRLT